MTKLGPGGHCDSSIVKDKAKRYRRVSAINLGEHNCTTTLN